ncbi:hypothetical protein ACOSP7_019471 [Xanthoceras sorbifolium]
MYMKMLIFSVFLVIASLNMQEVYGKEQVPCSRDEDCVGRIACGETPVACLDHVCECVIIGGETDHHTNCQYIPCTKDKDCSDLLHCVPENGNYKKCVDHKCV